MEQRLKAIMEKPQNWVAEAGKPLSEGFWTGKRVSIQLLAELVEWNKHPEPPKGELFSSKTRYSYCCNCNQWVGVTHKSDTEIICGECDYFIAEKVNGIWYADGDFTPPVNGRPIHNEVYKRLCDWGLNPKAAVMTTQEYYSLVVDGLAKNDRYMFLPVIFNDEAEFQFEINDHAYAVVKEDHFILRMEIVSNE